MLYVFWGGVAKLDELTDDPLEPVLRNRFV